MEAVIRARRGSNHMTAEPDGKLLIITGSHDLTIDFLLPFLPADRVFRLNTDLFREYKLVFDASGFTLTDPTGRSITNLQVYKAYWRWLEWPVANANEERYVQAEIRYLLQEMTNLLWYESKFVLVEPGATRRMGKVMQSIRAKEFFNVPPFRAGLNCEYRIQNGPEVVKSLSKSFSNSRIIFSTAVDPSHLAPDHPWFMQQYVNAAYDVTVVVVRNRLFAFKLIRDFLATSIDWREVPDAGGAWQPTELPETIRAAIFGYMNDMRLDFARLDFLMDKNEQLYFCEINPNAQYAWLDYDRKLGLLDAVLEELSPLTERHTIPVRHPLGSATADLAGPSRE
jgi:hypothetical protein